MNTLTLASIYESQGYKMEALEIYWKILEDEPDNSAAKAAIKRLSRKRRVFKNLYPEQTDKFVHMSSEDEYLSFEKWLIG